MFDTVGCNTIDDSRLADGFQPDDAVADFTVDDLWEPSSSDHSAAVGFMEPQPPSSADVAPSGAFALELDWATGSPGALSAAELVDAAVGFERLAAWAMARQQELLAAFHHRPDDGSLRPAAGSTASASADTRAWAVDEIGLALTLAPSTAATRMAHADRSDGVLRFTRDLLGAGKICPARARMIADLLTEYDDDVAAAVQARVLPRAPEQTIGQVRSALIRAIAAVVPDPEQRHKAARRERRVELWPARDGMATLSACLTAPEATASFDWITRIARGIPPAPEARGRGSMDRRRADVLVALLTGRLTAHPADTAASAAGADADSAAGDPTTHPPLVAAPVSAHRPLIHVTVPITTLMGVDDEPGELEGYGPIPAPLARQIAAAPDSTWRRLLTDPVSGTLLDYGRSTYRPPAALAGFVRARDAHCRYPGCPRPAVSCELDHVRPWAQGGTTSEDNVAALCERHHDLREQPDWQVVLHPDRCMEWITPTGHRYRSRPVDHRPPTERPQSPSPPLRSLTERCTADPPDPDDPPPFWRDAIGYRPVNRGARRSVKAASASGMSSARVRSACPRFSSSIAAA